MLLIIFAGVRGAPKRFIWDLGTKRLSTAPEEAKNLFSVGEHVILKFTALSNYWLAGVIRMAVHADEFSSTFSKSFRGVKFAAEPSANTSASNSPVSKVVSVSSNGDRRIQGILQRKNIKGSSMYPSVPGKTAKPPKLFQL